MEQEDEKHELQVDISFPFDFVHFSSAIFSVEFFFIFAFVRSLFLLQRFSRA